MLLSAGDFAVYRSETHVFDTLAPRFGDFREITQRTALLDTWLQSMFFERSGLAAEEIRRRILASCKSPGDFLRIVMGSIAEQQGMVRWADCTPEHVLHIAKIKRELPDALIIHIIRDGRDVALSLDKQGWIRPLPADRRTSWQVAGYFWEWMVQAGRKVGPEIGRDYLEVRFEDLVDRPRETLARIGCFIEHDLEYDQITAVGVGSVSNPNTSFATTAEDAGAFRPIGRWQRALPSSEIAMFEAALGNTLSRLGYELASSPPARRGLRASRARAASLLYQSLYSSKHWIKTSLPLSRYLVDTSLFTPAHS